MDTALTGSGELSRLRSANQVISCSTVCALPRVYGMASWKWWIGSLTRTILKSPHAYGPCTGATWLCMLLREMASRTRPEERTIWRCVRRVRHIKSNRHGGGVEQKLQSSRLPGRLPLAHPRSPSLDCNATRTRISSGSADSPLRAGPGAFSVDRCLKTSITRVANGGFGMAVRDPLSTLMRRDVGAGVLTPFHRIPT
jgi:hypothetical protein